MHVLGIILILSTPNRSFLLGLGVLAYTFGLRHAFDVDHIAAIDNTVRKLMQQQQRATGVGFYFSLGHSTVVFILAVLTALGTHWVQHAFPQLQRVGGLIGTSISGVFLFVIGALNVPILVHLFVLFGRLRHGHYPEQHVEALLHSRGFFARWMASTMKFITKSWHIYPVGFLFGLGFDTASEVALLTISAEASRASSVVGVFSLPILFAAGMSLMDTADGMFMTTAYQWAFTTPIRKLYYNLSVTGLGVMTAFLIGGVEIGQVLASEIHLNGPFWHWLRALSLGNLGYVLVALFLLTWLTSYGTWKFFRIEERWSRSASE